MSKENEVGMVGWYNPTQLIKTAKKTLVSTIIGKNADPRLVVASSVTTKFFDYSKVLTPKDKDYEITDENREELWIDYVADVGDGWNSTYSVAYSLTKQSLKLPEYENPLQRGEILIFGGDEVYPTATRKDYATRLIKPYEIAFKTNQTDTQIDETKVDLKQNPHVFAIPGNHDWYDSLVSFQTIFCTHFFNNRVFANSWKTRQTRSYFALKLPHNWWCFGIDFQLSHDIDIRQLQYFESVIESEVKKGDKVILCVPEPYWVKVIKYQNLTDEYKLKEESVELLEKLISKKKAEIRVYVAGDLHHYRRFESDGIHKITAGGGGAFLHPTHDYNFEKNNNSVSEKTEGKGFLLKTEYPEYSKSKNLGWQAFYGFIFKNGWFGFLSATLYILLAWMVKGEINGEFTWRKAFSETLQGLFDSDSSAGLLVLITLVGLVFFTDSKSKRYRIIAGVIHGLTHLFAIFVFGWLGYLLSIWIVGEYQIVSNTYKSLMWFLSIFTVAGLGGYLVGSIIMGIYLGVSLQFFKRHDNEAFSALKIEDFKNFLRFHIDSTGKLTIYPIKIEKVGREWDGEKKKQTEENLKQELIEKIEPIK